MAEPLINEQLQNCANMDRFVRNLKKCSAVNCTKGYLNGRLGGWSEKWKEFEALHKQIMLHATDEIQKKSEYFTADIYNQYEDLYYDILGKIKDGLDKFSACSSKLKTVVSDTIPVQPKLPPIDVPKFSGNYTEWRSFHDLFNSLVGQNSNLEDVQKLYYLKSSVTGEAEQLLRCYSVASSNYATAWKALCTRYDNNRLLVNAQLSVLLSHTAISKETASTIRALHDSTVESMSSLAALGIEVTTWDVAIIHIQTQRLPFETRQLWEKEISQTTTSPSIKTYLDFLEGRFRTLEALGGSLPKSIRKQTYTALSTNSPSVCICCDHDHHLRKCQKFQSFTTERRIEFVRSKNVCHNCLAHDHITNKCPSKRGCFRCGRHHHTLLHLNSPTAGPSVAPPRDPPVTSLHITNHCNQVLLSTALIVVRSNGHELTLRALIDTGSQSSFITTAAMQRLHLVPSTLRATIQGIGNTQTATKNNNKVVNFDVFSRFGDSRAIPVEAIVLPSLTGQLPQNHLSIPPCPHIKALNLADPSFQQPGRIDVILGADIYPFIIRDGLKTGPSNTPIAQNTTLGWILIGPIQSSSSSTPIYTFFSQIDLDHQLRRFWEIEEVEPISSASDDDKACEDHFRTTHRRDHEGRYIVQLPFKSLSTQLGSSYNRALIQLNSLHKRFIKNPSLRDSYTQCLNEYVELGHMEKIAGDDLNSQNHYYLPHHGVIKQSSATTKLRIVFNASSKSSSGMSLNDLLHVGPRLQQDIASVINKWRTFPIAFSSDMEKMYRQIKVNSSDADFQRLLWRIDADSPVEHFRLNTVTFGVSSAPFLAMRSIKQLVQDDGADLKLAATTLQENLYVDNILSGGDDVQEALETQRQLTTLLHRGGFKLRQWASNDSELLHQVPEADRLGSTEVDISCDQLDINALGLSWNPANDHLVLRFNSIGNNTATTKRAILSEISKLFDPLGWYTPITVLGKMFMQTLWLHSLGWDEPIPPIEQKQWDSIQSSLSSLQLITLPRWIRTTRHSIMEFHGFCDSSNRAYAAVIYLRVQQGDGYHTSILMAKTKVAPVKTISLPRLELCGATLLSALAKRILQDLNLFEIPLYCWTDSTIVLAWLKQHPCHWKTFVANRVSTIRERIPTARWQHVPSKENAADVATRGSSPDALKGNTLWWSGPNWLLSSTENWPKQQIHSTSEEIKRIVTLSISAVFTQPILTLVNYSSYNRLIRVTAYCQRFINNLRKPASERTLSHLQVDELNHALQYWIRVEQLNHLSEEIQMLEDDVSTRKPKRDKQIKSLAPFLDKNEILRVGGRLRHADLPYHQKHPILLSHHSHLSKLIVAQCHSSTLHGGPTLMMAKIRQTYWITNLRTLVRSCIHHCVTCFRLKKETSQQLMGDLPKARITPSRPFSSVGVDFAGPLSLRMSKGRNCRTYKGYVAIFVCFATKAIHLEAVSDLTTEAFLASLRRFFARRGLSAHIYSDCGTNFVGAKAALDKTYSNCIAVATAQAAELLVNDHVNWHFIPPGSPHFGGLWEAGVRSTKHHLRRVMGNNILTYEELATVLTQIEACLNSRPLCHLTDDPDDFGVLTPGHFLIGDALNAPPQDDLQHIKLNRLNRWSLLQKLVQDFWYKWTSEYLHKLQQRPKWQEPQPNPEVGQLVIIKDERLPPLKWMMGRIIATHPGSDGRIRVVDLKTSRSTLRRPVQKLCFLPSNKLNEPYDHIKDN